MPSESISFTTASHARQKMRELRRLSGTITPLAPLRRPAAAALGGCPLSELPTMAFSAPAILGAWHLNVVHSEAWRLTSQDC